MELIDTHVFYGKSNFPKFEFDIETLRNATKLNGGVKFIAASASPETNKEIASVVKENKDVLAGGYLQVIPKRNLPWEYTPPNELEHLLEDEKILGLNIVTRLVGVPINSQYVTPYAELATYMGVPIMFHICKSSKQEFTSYEKNKELIQNFPNLTVILEHFGGLNPDYVEGSLSLVREFDNVYLNTTGMSGEIRRIDIAGDGEPKLVEHSWVKDMEYWPNLLRECMKDDKLKHRILLGTDFPYLSSENYDLSFISKLSDRDLYQINQNALEAFNLSQ